MIFCYEDMTKDVTAITSLSLLTGPCCLHRSELRCLSWFLSLRFVRKPVPTAEVLYTIEAPVMGTPIAQDTAAGASVHL